MNPNENQNTPKTQDGTQEPTSNTHPDTSSYPTRAHATSPVADPLAVPSPAERPNPKAKTSYPWLKDLLGIFLFIVAVIVGAWLINTLIFRSFSVVGPSMESTMYTGDRLIVNRIPMTAAAISGKTFTPSRDEVIVFKNPNYEPGMQDEYIVKRVIGLPGERVVVKDCGVTVYNSEHPNGFDPYENVDIPKVCVSGEVDITVPDDEIFVIGDHRNGNYSLDSRSGLGTIPLSDIVGPVAFRIWPVNKIQGF